jgi:hypothetical protein
LAACKRIPSKMTEKQMQIAIGAEALLALADQNSLPNDIPNDVANDVPKKGHWYICSECT